MKDLGSNSPFDSPPTITTTLDKFCIGLSPKVGKGFSVDDHKRLIPHVRNVIAKYFRGKVISSQKCASHRRHLAYSDDGKFRLACVHSGYAGPTPFLNFEFNPTTSYDKYRGELDALFAMSLPDHWDTLFEHGVCSRIELAVDVAGVPVTDLALVDVQRRIGTLYKGTQYLGRRTSDQAIVMYDRVALAKAKSAPLPESAAVTRIEARLTDRTLSFKSLLDAAGGNPFDSFIVVPRTALVDAAIHWKRPAMALGLLQPGLSALTKGNPHGRIAVLDFLRDREVGWWAKDKIWAAHRLLLEDWRGQKGYPLEPMF